MELMDSPRFILYGIGGVYNYGCEAIVRGTVRILRREFPDCGITYFSRRPEEDRAALKDCPVHVVSRPPFRNTYVRTVLKVLLRRLGLPNHWILMEPLKPFNQNAVVISIGGDIFTLGKGPFPKYSRPEYLDTHFALARRKQPYVLWGASVGPFEAWPECVPTFRNFLQSLTLITVREPVTAAYLQGLGVSTNVVPVADPAFLMELKSNDEDVPSNPAGEPLIGVNLSPLSVDHIYGVGNYDKAIQVQTEFLTQVMNQTGARLLLIPHVICPGHTADDDVWYLRKIQEQMPAHLRHRVSMLEPGLGAQRTKGAIARCDALLAARMHCAIAGVSSGTPTLFIAYSAKASGMCEFVYGHRDCCIRLDELAAPDTLARVADFWNRRLELKVVLKQRRPQLEAQSFRAGELLRQKLQQMNCR